VLLSVEPWVFPCANRVFDTQFCVQIMENIAELWYFLVPFFTQRGLSCVLVLVASNRVVLFFNRILEEILGGGDHKYCIFLYRPLLRVRIPLVLNTGDGLEECKSNLFPIGKILDQKIAFEQIQPFIYSIHIYQSFT
jgi:hypothetical protein